MNRHNGNFFKIDPNEQTFTIPDTDTFTLTYFTCHSTSTLQGQDKDVCCCIFVGANNYF